MNTVQNFPAYSNFLNAACDYSNSEKDSIANSVANCFNAYNRFIHAALPIVYMLDFTQKRYVYMTHSIKSVLGYSGSYVMEGGIDLIISRYHPDDAKLYFGEIFMKNISFLKQQPVETHKDFLLGYNYRFKKKNGEYATLLQRHSMIQSAPNGTPLLMLSFLSDITEYKTDSKIIHTIEKIDGQQLQLVEKNFYFADQGDSRLSKKEIEVLKWIINGLSSKQVANKMRLSIHTINNHRKNMLQKTNCKNVAELLHFAIQQGLL